MKTNISFLTILSIGAFAGNMINIGLSYGIHWQSLEPIEFMKSFKVDFPLLLAPTALTLMPAWLGSLWLFYKSEQQTQTKRLFLYSFLLLTLVVIQTSVFHLPMNLDFMAMQYDAATASFKLHSWILSHWIRIGLAITSGIYALLAFQKQTIN